MVIVSTAEDLAVVGGTSAATFWEASRAALDGLPGGGLNIAHEAVDRHLGTECADRVAIRWLGRRGARVELSYRDLAAETSRFANALVELGVRPGERVFVLAGRVPLLYVSVLGALKHGSVLSPLFAAFGPEPIRTRLQIGEGRVLVTTSALYRRNVSKIRNELPGLRHVLVLDEDSDDDAPEGTRSLPALLARQSDRYEIEATDEEDMALLHFTSGTTGTPKGAIHVHQAVVAHHATGTHALDLRAGDIYWCTADPGWVTGTSYGIISPLTHGATMIVDEADFDARRWYRILQDEGVNVWYTAPTAIRMLMRAGDDLAREHDLGRLRFVASVGEPLHAEGVLWGRDVLGTPIHDNWWQTETGGIMIANQPGLEVEPGSMGTALPGVTAAILDLDERGDVRLRDDGQPMFASFGVEGELALRIGWPSMFRGYLGQPERYRKCFVGDWYRSGDLATIDAAGHVWFVGRADDVIKTAGHLIGPFEVESALLEHPAVVEAGVIGIPDDVAGQIVKAFVTLAEGVAPSEEVRRELLGHARARLGPAVAPREIAFDQHLPRTRSGKIMRRLLKARELGLPEGDTSTLESDR